jgi:hypothetical protein
VKYARVSESESEIDEENFPLKNFIFLASLHNYFIMYGIKYFFSIKIIRQFRGGKKIFRKGQIIENIIFQNSGGTAAPSPLWIRPDHFIYLSMITIDMKMKSSMVNWF